MLNHKNAVPVLHIQQTEPEGTELQRNQVFIVIPNFYSSFFFCLVRKIMNMAPQDISLLKHLQKE